MRDKRDKPLAVSVDGKADSVASAVDEVERALQSFLEKMNRFGQWDDGCFYYQGRSACELQSVIEKGSEALGKLRLARARAALADTSTDTKA